MALDASNVINFVLSICVEMRPKDVTFIAEQPITCWNRVVQQIVPTLINAGVGAMQV